MTKARILIVEDEAIIAKHIEKRLQSLGYSVCGMAASGDDAFKKVESMRPDLILMDIMLLGQLDGIETAQQVKHHYDIPIVYLTSYSDDKTLERAKITAPYGYITKPVEDKDLRITIEIALHNHSLERKLRESEQWLYTTLKSIGDGVIATDLNLCIKFMNPVARKLTGWSEQAALGEPIQEVFRTVNKNTQENTVDDFFTVIQKRTIVAFFNQTLLDKNNREIPIDECVSPIIDERGAIHGVIFVFRDVTERIEAQETLNKQREKFISVLIHDLKGLLTPIIGFSKRLLAGKAKNEEERIMSLDVIRQSSEDLLKIIENTSKKLREKTLLLSFEPKELEFKDLIVSSVLDTMPELEVKGVEILINNKGKDEWDTLERATIYADPFQMKTLVNNLLGNALKYTASVIKVEYHRHDANLRFLIADDGPGIPQHYAGMIFREYFQIPGSKKGAGIGLYSVSRVVESHKGKITVQSSSSTQGAIFEVILPCLVCSHE